MYWFLRFFRSIYLALFYVVVGIYKLFVIVIRAFTTGDPIHEEVELLDNPPEQRDTVVKSGPGQRDKPEEAPADQEPADDEEAVPEPPDQLPEQGELEEPPDLPPEMPPQGESPPYDLPDALGEDDQSDDERG